MRTRGVEENPKGNFEIRALNRVMEIETPAKSDAREPEEFRKKS